MPQCCHESRDIEAESVSPATPPTTKTHTSEGRKSKDKRAKLNSRHLRDELYKINNEPFVTTYQHTAPPFRESVHAVTPEMMHLVELLKHSALFANETQGALVKVAQHMTQICLGPRSRVIKQGDTVYGDDCMFVLEEGDVEIKITAAQPVSLTKSVGFMFGEVGVLFGANRSASIISVGPVTLSCLSRNDLLSMLHILPTSRLLLFLRSLSLLQGLTDQQIIDIAPVVKSQQFAPGETIISFGAKSDSIYIVYEGQVNVNVPSSDNCACSTVAVLGAGKLIGQRAVMTNKTRTADCVAVGAVKVLCIAAADFGKLNNPILEWVMDSEALLTVLRQCTNQNTADILMNSYIKRTVPRGVTLLCAGARTRTLYIVVSGGVSGGQDIEGYTYCGNLWNSVTPTDVITTHDSTLIRCDMGHAEEPSMALARTEHITRDELTFLKHVAQGSVGSVDLVQSNKTHELYCLKQVQYSVQNLKTVQNEAQIMQQLNSPFCVKMFNIFEAPGSVGLLMEWVQGGELFYHMSRPFREQEARFYAACVVVGLTHVHERGLLYRDLKPENLLLDARGYPKLADFGFAKQVYNELTYTFCGTSEYQAPEVMTRQGHGEAADWWSLGVLIYEMLTNDTPFKANEGWELMRTTQTGRFHMPEYISPAASSLISGLLHVVPHKRLSALQVKQHAWFEGLSWNAVVQQKLKPPIIPHLSNPADTTYFQ